MRKTIITTLSLILLFIFLVPKYTELNNVMIIDGIGIIKNKDTYTVYLREIIPKKTDNGLTYTYKIYENTAKSILDSINNIEKKSKKTLYLKQVKILVTNYDSNKIKKELKLKTKLVYHTNNVKNKLKKSKIYS